MNTREQAIVYLIIVLLTLVMVFVRKNGILKSLVDAFKYTIILLLNPISVVILFSNIVYIGLMYYFSKEYNWNISLWYMKDYLMVLFFSVFPIIVLLKKASLKEILHDKKTELFGIATIPLFINSEYTFSLFTEIMLILFLTIISILLIELKKRNEYPRTIIFFDFIVISIGLFMIIGAMIKFFWNIEDVFKTEFWMVFGVELFVWVMNIPIIWLIKKMITIENKVLFSKDKNKMITYMKFYIQLLVYKIKFKKYRKLELGELNLKVEGREFSTVGGNRIYIEVSKRDLSDEILIALVSDAVLGENRHTNIINQREKYPNVVEIVDDKLNLYVFWQDSFRDDKWRDDRCDDMETIELIEGIKVIK